MQYAFTAVDSSCTTYSLLAVAVWFVVARYACAVDAHSLVNGPATCFFS
jgi:hypothetical protein